MLPKRSHGPGRSKPSGFDATDDLADAHRATENFSNWIHNADTKAGLLAAALAVVIAAIGQKASVIPHITRLDGSAEVTGFVVLCLLGAAVAAALLALALVVTPRTSPPAVPSRFGFPTVSSPAWRGEPASRAQAASEAWSQASVLAGIASTKFATLRVAAIATFAALALLLTWIVVVSFVH